MGFFDKLKQGLQKTKQLLQTDVRDLLKPGEILTEETLGRFEAVLVQSDMGVTAVDEIVAELRKHHLNRTVVVDEIWTTVKDKLRVLLKGEGEEEIVTWDIEQPLSPLTFAQEGPTVILVAGVNGVGKTTSIAKLAHLMQQQGHKVVLAAADTFRAAAVEQLTMWSERIGCEIVKKESGADPASVAHQGCTRLLESGADVLIVDTAGRLQTQKNLMSQLEKINRVISNQIPDAPHECLLVLDATTGQNAISQAQNFSDSVNCTGIILAKLDGSAKGGVVIPIRQKMGIPVKFVGVGEQIEDLQIFDPDSFVDAMMGD